MQSEDDLHAPYVDEHASRGDSVSTLVVIAAAMGDSSAVLARVTDTSGQPPPRAEESEADGSEEEHGDTISRYWIPSNITVDELDELQSDGVLLAKNICH